MSVARLDRRRILAIGVAVPIAIVLLAWWIAETLPGLPDELPSHFASDGTVSFLPTGSMAASWLIGAAFTAAIAISVCLGSLRGGWHPLGRGATAAAVGVVGAVVSGLLGQLLLARGRTSLQLEEFGAGPSILFVFGGFAVFLAVALTLLPKGCDEDE